MYASEMNECVAPESKRVHARIPNKKMVPVTTSLTPRSSSSSTSTGVKVYTLAWAGRLGGKLFPGGWDPPRASSGQFLLKWPN
jgi:hypothetical protein